MAGEKLTPYVVVDYHRNTGIFLLRGRKFVRIVGRDPHFRLRRIPLREFDEDWKPLHYYSNGVPTAVPYDIQAAARQYLEFGKNAGITEGALRCLKTILEGSLDMSVVESAQTQESESLAKASNGAIPKMEDLGDALNKANGKTKKASTKNGTTAAAKRPSKAKAVPVGGADDDKIQPAPNKQSNSTQENAMKSTQAGKGGRKVSPAVVAKSVKNGKIAGEKKPKEKKKAPAAKKPAPKTKSKKSATATGHGRVPKFSDDAIITFVADNPKRQGTDAFRKFAQYKKGMRLGDVVKKNVDRADVNYNISRGFVKVKG